MNNSLESMVTDIDNDNNIDNTQQNTNSINVTKTVYNNIIDEVLTEIQTVNLTQTNTYDLLHNLSIIIENKDSSLDFTNLYNNLVDKLQSYDNMYIEKFDDLCGSILKNMEYANNNSGDIIVDENGMKILITKPILERSRQYNHLYSYIQDSELYILISSIKDTMRKVIHYENTYMEYVT